MRILFDIVHPADVLFFLNPIRRLQERGHTVTVASRRKDVAEELLDAYQIDHEPISMAGSGWGSLARELLVRDWALIRLARRSKSDILTGFGGVAAAHAGTLLRKPSIVFYDTNTATLQNRLCYPFASEIHVPAWYDGPLPPSRTFRFSGLKEQSYLDPKYFKSDVSRAVAAGLDLERDNFLVRVVGWGASHDIGKRGWSDETLRQLVAFLSTQGKVHLCSERPLPENLATYRFRGRAADVHHLMASCRLVVSESVTMATEACVLGVPSVFAAPFELSNVIELERRGLIGFVRGSELEQVLSSVDTLLRRSFEDWQRAHGELIADTIDVAQYVTDTLLRRGSETG